MSQSPEAYERLILDAMRGDATLFTRNDEVEAQWEICDPIVTRGRTTPGPLPTVRGRHAGPAEADRLLEHGAQLARDLGATDGHRRHGLARAATPSPARSRPRCAPRCRRSTARTPATCRRACSTSSASSTRSGAARSPTGCAASGATTRRARSSARSSPGARRSTRSRRSRRRREVSAGRDRAAARDDRRRVRRRATSPHLDRIVDPLVVTDLLTLRLVAARPRRGRRRAAGPGPDRAARPRRRARPGRRARTARASSRTRPTSSTSRGCARRRGASGSPRRSTRRRCAPSCARSRSVTIRHHPDSAAAALLLLGWLASRLDWQPEPADGATAAACEGSAHAPPPGHRAARWSPTRRCRCRGLAGLTLETAVGPLARARTAAPAACAPRYRHTRGTEREWTILGASRGEAGHPRRGHPPGAAARPDLRAGADAQGAAELTRS